MTTKAPWKWENGECECSGFCTPNGCAGHDNGIPYALEPVGLYFDILEYSPSDDDIERWIEDARLIQAAPALLVELEKLVILIDSALNDEGESGSLTTQPARQVIKQVRKGGRKS